MNQFIIEGVISNKKAFTEHYMFDIQFDNNVRKLLIPTRYKVSNGMKIRVVGKWNYNKLEASHIDIL